MHLGKSRFLVLTFASLILLTLTACADVAAADLALDLDTLQASGPDGTYQATPIAEAHVGEVTEDLFIAVVVEEAAETREGQMVTAYLCNGADYSQWLTGELDADGHAVLAEEIGAKVALTVAEDGQVTGVVEVPGEEMEAFTAEVATGEAGLYRAEETFDGEARVGGWIVLPDGRQKGARCCGCFPICFPDCCGTSPGRL